MLLKPVPRAIGFSFEAAVGMTEARARLGALRPVAGSTGLKVYLEDGRDAVQATVPTRGAPSLVGMLEPTVTGVRLRVALVPSAVLARAQRFLFAIAVANVSLALLFFIRTPDGRAPSGFLLTGALGVVFANLAVFARIRDNWLFARTGEQLTTGVASVLGCPPPSIRAQEVAAPTRWFAGPAFGALLVVVFSLLFISISHAPHPSRGLVFAGTTLAVSLVVVPLTRWWLPRLDGSVLRVGFSRVDLERVEQVVARRSAMSLADDRGRVVIPWVYGTVTSPADLDEAPFDVWSSPGPRVREAALAIDGVLRRTALDPSTAEALYRSPTATGTVRHPPLVLPIVLVRWAAAVVAVVAGAAAMSTVA